jgi:hypothetical protein
MFEKTPWWLKGCWGIFYCFRYVLNYWHELSGISIFCNARLYIEIIEYQIKGDGRRALEKHNDCRRSNCVNDLSSCNPFWQIGLQGQRAQRGSYLVTETFRNEGFCFLIDAGMAAREVKALYVG